MNKIISSFLLLITIFFSCLAISIFIKKHFGIEGDYLSAFATLAATSVAFFLVADWKEQSFLNLFLQTSRRITTLCDKLFNSYDNFKNFLYEMNDKELARIDQENFRLLSKEFMNIIDNLLLEMDQQKLLLQQAKKRTKEYDRYYQNILDFENEIMSLIRSLEVTKNANLSNTTKNILKVLANDNLKFQGNILQYKYSIRADSDKVISEMLK
ncbi:hypothetical protein [Acinetobacter seifertii]|uniref:hypothetical protein n=1 Tax=Acinetobacter seifertii TaxID=1530123 RepID=UPI003F51F718